MENACTVGSHLYSDLEGLRIAIEIEARGREFYRQAYNQAENAEHKALFMVLMNEEIQHQERFTEIYHQIQKQKEASSDDYLFDPDTSRYLTILAESHVFPPQEQAVQVIAELKSVSAILKVAVQAEKDSILFYDELASCAKFAESKKIFQLLKEEERTHVIKLRAMVDTWA